MAKLFILIKRRGSKGFLGAIPVKAGVTVARLRALLRKALRTGFTAKIVSSAVVNRLIKKGLTKAVKSIRKGAGRLKRRITRRLKGRKGRRLTRKQRMALRRRFKKARRKRKR